MFTQIFVHLLTPLATLPISLSFQAYLSRLEREPGWRSFRSRI